MTPALLVLGGGPFAAPALRWAREAGLTPFFCDFDPRSSARALAHEFQPLNREDAGTLQAFVRRLARGPDALAGVLALEARTRPLLVSLAEVAPQLVAPRAALERTSSPERLATELRARGFACATPTPDQPVLDVFAFFRDGAFVPGGLATRQTHGADEQSIFPSGLVHARTHAAHVLVERAARALELTRGPLQATLVETGSGFAFVALASGFQDALGAMHVARLAYGKSPLQAWFAHLAGAGGPFDELSLVPERCAGWFTLGAQRSGVFAGLDGAARARALPGIAGLLLEEPGCTLDAHAGALATLWAEGHDREELEERLLAARAELRVRVTGTQRVA